MGTECEKGRNIMINARDVNEPEDDTQAVEIVAALPMVARASECRESPIRAGSQSVGGHPLTLDSSYMSYLEKDG